MTYSARAQGLLLLALVLIACETNSAKSTAPTDSKISDSFQDVQATDQNGDIHFIDSRREDAPSPEDHQSALNETDIFEQISIRFSQAVGNYLWANPELNPRIPLRIQASTQVDSVEIIIGTKSVASSPMGDTNSWVAVVDISEINTGDHILKAVAYLGDASYEQEATLRMGTTGIQFTNYDEVGPAATPRLHLQDGDLWISWVDRRNSEQRAWLQQIDGAGSPAGELTPISPPNQKCVAARTVWGNSSIALLYQDKNESYRNWLQIVNKEGQALLNPTQLETENLEGTWGGDISYDGEAFVAVWRNRNPETNKSEIRWLKIQESDLTVTGPVVVTASGEDDPTGNFLPQTFIRASAINGRTVVTFVRDLYNNLFEMTIPTNYATHLGGDGTILHEGILQTGLGFPFGFESHVHKIQNEFLVLWTAIDVYDGDDNNPNQPYRIFGAKVAPDFPRSPALYTKTQILIAPHARGEVEAIEHPHHYAVLAWTDQRTHVENALDGRIDLRFQPIDKDLKLANKCAKQVKASTPLGTMALEIYNKFCEEGNETKDFSAISKVVGGDAWNYPID